MHPLSDIAQNSTFCLCHWCSYKENTWWSLDFMFKNCLEFMFLWHAEQKLCYCHILHLKPLAVNMEMWENVYMMAWNWSKYVPCFFLRDWEVLICVCYTASCRDIHSVLILTWKAGLQCELAQMMRELERWLMGLFNERPSSWPCEGLQGSPILTDWGKTEEEDRERSRVGDVGWL